MRSHPRSQLSFFKTIGTKESLYKFTYKQLNERVNRLSNALLNKGIGKGDRVAILSYNCNQMLEAYQAVKEVGLKNVRLGNIGIFVKTDEDYEALLKEASDAI